ncbi:hypothetical protein PORCRE_2042 [Porphyromonas crevioricanis JCM 15906]|uniref:Uncharacterized protein n=1 Tax=Porphyromonas crevioricanis JCM 15906 TaxID=1305617 RepID=T1DU73_9PORP|nr:hypothetical protein PORCRE_2042 [Porphyromonas crevioricanis JCM 15906]
MLNQVGHTIRGYIFIPCASSHCEPHVRNFLVFGHKSQAKATTQRAYMIRHYLQI